MTTGQIGALAAALAAVVGLVTLMRSLREYLLQGRQKRTDAFLAKRKDLTENRRRMEILALVQDDDAQLSDPVIVPYHEKYELLGYFEEVAFMMNSGLIKPRVAWYMFGYYTLSIDRSSHFWADISRDDLYWSVFNHFVDQMDQFEIKQARRKLKHGYPSVAQRSRMRF